MQSVRSIRSITFLVILTILSIASLAQSAKSSPGQELFKAKCVLCHGSDGTGKTTLGQQMKASDLHSVGVQKQTDAELTDAILHGKGNMPGFDSQLAGDDLTQILSYVRQFGKRSKAMAHPMQR